MISGQKEIQRATKVNGNRWQQGWKCHVSEKNNEINCMLRAKILSFQQRTSSQKGNIKCSQVVSMKTRYIIIRTGI